MPVASNGGMPSKEWYPRSSGQVQNWMLYADAARPGTTQNDYFDGGGDVTSYAGGAGDDWYVVHHSTDAITERPGEGADTVLAWADYRLAEGIDNLTLLPGPGLVATGNSVGNIIIGNDGNNTIDGGDASDDLTGGAGRDLFIERAGESDFDIIKDFESHDVVRLEGWGFASFAEVQSAMEQFTGVDGQPAVRLMKTVTTPDGSISTAAVTFEHRTLADFSAANFEFGAGSGSSSSGSGTTTPPPHSEPIPPSEGAAQPTPDVARSYLAPDASGTARGSAAAEDIYATADGQTLIGGGGDDIFHVGTRSVTIDASGTGISTVETWNGRYALNDGVDNLVALGSYGHTLAGNALANWITAGSGNDTLEGKGGADVLTGGGGADSFIVRSLGEGGDRILDWSTGDRLGMFAVERRELFIRQDGEDTGIYVNAAAPFEEPDLHLVASLADTTATSFDPYRDIFFV